MTLKLVFAASLLGVQCEEPLKVSVENKSASLLERLGKAHHDIPSRKSGIQEAGRLSTEQDIYYSALIAFSK